MVKEKEKEGKKRKEKERKETLSLSSNLSTRFPAKRRNQNPRKNIESQVWKGGKSPERIVKSIAGLECSRVLMANNS